jgi:hypothetical protein
VPKKTKAFELKLLNQVQQPIANGLSKKKAMEKISIAFVF